MEIRRVELLASAVQKQRSTTELYPPLHRELERATLMGYIGLEPTTSVLSGQRSNQLS